MKIDALLFADVDISDRDLSFNDMYIPELLAERLRQVETIGDCYYALPDSYSGNLKGKNIFRIKNADDSAFWKSIFQKCGSDHIVKIYIDSPFLDPDIIAAMVDVHVRYLAEYTYSENLPAGFSCEIYSKELIATLPETEEKTLSLNDIIRSNINQFDVELFYHEPDIRDKRLSFRNSNPRDRRIMETIYAHLGRVPAYSEISSVISSSPEILYICPSYLEIELTGRCDLDCIFCYRKTLSSIHGDMEIDNFRKVLTEMKHFELPYSICFGGSGEPLMHNNFYTIMELSQKEESIENIVIETNGLYADDNLKSYLLSTHESRVKLIFNMNGYDEDTYRSIHRHDSFTKVFNNIIALREALNDGPQLYLQIMKINETEKFLDKYYDFWETYDIPIILQKQNTYLGKISDRRYSDLSPLERTPCWHLQRDLYILSDGRVGFCKQDIDGTYAKGSIENESLVDIWSHSKKYFLNDYQSNFATSPDCKSCDEWYTFNL